jgi:small subunit ribosomal protein S14
MKKLLRKDLKIRQNIMKYESKRLLLKSLLTNMGLDANQKLKFQMQLATLPKKSSKTQVHNRCFITGRGHGIYQLFHISRIQLKTLALNGELPGVKKYSW